VASEAKTRETGQRLGVTVSRRVGNAVVRNRVKRGIREWFRRHRGELEEHLEVVVIARGATAELSAMEIANELNGLLVTECSR
jgi:ribonuclease P protein component